MHLREGSIDDMKQLMRIERICFGAKGFSRQLVESLLLEESVTTYVAEESNEIVGYGMLLNEEVGWSARIISLAVLPEHRLRGIARELMRLMEEMARSWGSKKLALEVGVANVPALNLYLHSGFHIEGTVPDYYGKSLDAFYLEKRLT
ncbi:MAG: GNAT family N-acetyltransferase [Methanomassiliicoccales archaeon]|nr:GNAT family N-acetyltransferase [Methanomassiliicoccales archaeon]